MKKINTLTGLALIGSLALTSCATVNPYTGERKTSNTTKGAVAGALGGAALGALIGNNRSGGKSRKGAVAGALGGALVGGVIGRYMDQQEAAIRQQLEGSGVSVSRSGNDLILNMPSDITFGSGSSNLQSRFTSTLNSVALVLKKYKKTNLSIVGHTDSDGSDSYNRNLSVARASSVANFLNRSGVASNRLYSTGMGETRPIASNSSSSGKAQNRRVEIKIEPLQSQF